MERQRWKVTDREKKMEKQRGGGKRRDTKRERNE